MSASEGVEDYLLKASKATSEPLPSTNFYEMKNSEHRYSRR
jgi:hypothetical protein